MGDHTHAREGTIPRFSEGTNNAFCAAKVWSRPCRRWVIRYRSLRAENRSMSAVPRKRRKVRALASVAKGHGGNRRERLQRPVMMVWRDVAVQFPGPRLRLSAADTNLN